jgi:hypothetical protein
MLRGFKRLTQQALNRMNRSAKYATAIVAAHLLVNIVHGLAHRELHVGLAPFDSIFITVVVLIFPLQTAASSLSLATE